MNQRTPHMRDAEGPGHKSLGAVGLEFALVLPVFLVLVMGLVESGNMFRSWLTVQKAAQQGARFAATGQGEVEGNRLALIRDAVREMLVSLTDEDETGVAIYSWATIETHQSSARSENAGGPCEFVEVEVAYPYEPITPVIAQLMPDTVSLVGRDRKVNEPWEACEEEQITELVEYTSQADETDWSWLEDLNAAEDAAAQAELIKIAPPDAKGVPNAASAEGGGNGFDASYAGSDADLSGTGASFTAGMDMSGGDGKGADVSEEQALANAGYALDEQSGALVEDEGALEGMDAAWEEGDMLAIEETTDFAKTSVLDDMARSGGIDETIENKSMDGAAGTASGAPTDGMTTGSVDETADVESGFGTYGSTTQAGPGSKAMSRRMGWREQTI